MGASGSKAVARSTTTGVNHERKDSDKINSTTDKVKRLATTDAIVPRATSASSFGELFNIIIFVAGTVLTIVASVAIGIISGTKDGDGVPFKFDPSDYMY